MNSVLRLASDCRSLIRSWLAVDRIRVTPTAGRLLTLRPGQTILLCGELVQVIEQKVTTTAFETRITYLLDNPGDCSALEVRLCSVTLLTTAHVSFRDRVTEVLDEDVVVVRPE